MNWKAHAIRNIVKSALSEDRAASDITTNTLIDPTWSVQAVLRAKDNGVIAGLPLAAQFFRALGKVETFQLKVREGAQVKRVDVLAVIKGNARVVLAAERPALNALQHLSGIATFTHHALAHLKGTKTRLYDTRKTLPGWRLLQKYAVKCGGGTMYRISLADAILIKDNHLKINRLAGDNWVPKAKRFRIKNPRVPFEVEIQTERDLRDVLQLKPHIVLLDNMGYAKLKRMIKILRRDIPGVQIEISGGVKSEDLRKLGRLGVERISMGRLTHSVKALDISLEITGVSKGR